MAESGFTDLVDGPVLHLSLRTEYVPAGPGRVTPVRVLRVRGEVDAVTAPRLADALARAQVPGPLPGGSPQRVVVDVSAMTFCSARGLAVLHGAAERSGAEQGTVSIAGLSARLAGLLTALWPPPYPELHLAPAATLGLDDPRRVGSPGTRATAERVTRPGGAPRCVPAVRDGWRGGRVTGPRRPTGERRSALVRGSCPWHDPWREPWHE